ncbi:mannitol dehydrogenase family protein [Saccharopolyspora sp. K220]|uniref:mannitol dehydrogenase family protein n=1 Tax=Saccharopolyspora soli TaxID=2926618 RepID=UPI001F58B787|nr:mannitol dehydrogenase family protein [Saccharopolyspora soli]MCI2417327.1 mannitol dehydrogenase family protein [Saccharopolyspora soli]
MNRLNATTTPDSALLHRRTLRETGIVHLGLGNFHRAHQAVFTAAALDHTDGPWGILGVASRSGRVVDAMHEQDLRYSVVEISPQDTRIVVPAVHTGAFVAAQQPEAVLDAIAAPGTAIVTLTVTENGYTYSPRTRGLDFDNPAVRADLSGASPTTTIGQLTRALQRRLRAHAAPITILSCDNLTGNGTHTARLVREFAAALPADERDELTAWLAEAVTFPNSMVDRIVPATTDAYQAAVAEQLGLCDTVPVPAEPFSMWVLEDDFAAGRPRWEHGGARFTADVVPYELLKLRLLNGTHSLIAYLGALSGCDTIAASTAQPFVAEAARRVLCEDYLPTIAVPADIDIDDYIAQLFDRWGNTALGHRTRQVGSDGSAKLAQRIPDAALRHLRAGRVPQHLALTVAAYLCCMAPPEGFEAGPHAAAMADPNRASLVAAAERTGSTAAFVTEVFRSGLLGDELATRTEFVSRVAEFVDIIAVHGPAAAAAEAADQEPASAWRT